MAIKLNKGDIYNKLIIIEEIEPRKDSKGYNIRRVKCKCECGNITTKDLNAIRSGNTKSCGCYNIKKNKTHGMVGTKIYRVHHDILQRCNNIANKHFKDYGGRGIKCEWDSFEEFYKDMGESYKEGLTIERINVNGNYCKDNCTWATQLEQGKNRRNNIHITYMGETKILSEWARDTGINLQTLTSRYKKNKYINGNIFYKTLRK